MKLLKEPLVHFLIAGGLLFAGYAWLHRGEVRTETSRRIEITADDIRRMEISHLARWQRPPTEDEMRGLINEQVREEILYREALALGMEKNDTIIKRRLAQKMDFLAEDVAALREPAPGELESWFAKHRERFAPPTLATFHHLYFSPDKRGTGAEAEARRKLAELAGKAGSGGDAFMFERAYAEQTPEEVARVFGSKFTDRLFREPPGAWRGPIESGYGWHLVWIDALRPSVPPALEEVADRVRAEWLTDQRGETRRASFAALKARYEIVVAKPSPESPKVAVSTTK